VQAQHRIAAPVRLTVKSRFGDAIISHCLQAIIADLGRVSYAQSLGNAWSGRRACPSEGWMDSSRGNNTPFLTERLSGQSSTREADS
jgi:hypothetical protein